MIKPLVSIILPSYNHARFLQQRIETILHQTYDSIELIILDDCSQDGSRDILEKYKDHSAVSKIIYNETNSGSTFHQWRKGISLANGQFIWIAESDDFSDLHFLASVIGQITSHHNVVLSYCRSEIVSENGKRLGIHKWMDELDIHRWTEAFFNTGEDEINNYLRYRNTIPNASAAVFKRINGMEKWIRPDMKFAGDWYFWIQLLRNGNITYSPSPMNFFRRHSFSTRQQQSFDQEIRRLKEYFAVICDGFKITRKGLCNYDWVIDEWLSRKKAFSHKPEFFFPPFPTMMFMRFYWKLLRYSNRREFSL